MMPGKQLANSDYNFVGSPDGTSVYNHIIEDGQSSLGGSVMMRVGDLPTPKSGAKIIIDDTSS